MTDDISIRERDALDVPLVNIPASLFEAFPHRRVILRTDDPRELPAVLGPEVPERVAFAQLTDLTRPTQPLQDWGEGLALDLLMTEPEAQFPSLYRHIGLFARHPVRVSVPMVPGVARAVKLAVSLGFAVRLVGHQPTPEAIGEARQALDHYLHNPSVAQPVEFFHGVLLALLHGFPVSLWSLLEADPLEVRWLDSLGQEPPGQLTASAAAFRDGLLAAGAECAGCAWLAVCRGYFKWPHADYSCVGVKELFADIQGAAGELRQALATHDAVDGG